MDLLTCSQCERRFYVSAADLPDTWCSHCGGSLEIALRQIVRIPLDARWLDPQRAARVPELTIVDLRRKRESGGKSARKRIVRGLAQYFDVKKHGRSLEVMVNRGERETAALRVAAVLDGVDTDWEEHFYLPTVERETASERKSPPPPVRKHLRLIDPGRNGTEPGSQHA
jgi:PHP family Zn ribbon phosphoesterase